MRLRISSLTGRGSGTGFFFVRQLLTLSVLMLFFLHPLQGEKPWTPVLERDEIQVFNRDIPDELLPELRATTTLEASIEVVGEVLADLPAYTEWFHSCSASRLLREDGSGGIYHYLQISAPWPVQPRDVVLHTEIRFDRRTGFLHLVSRALGLKISAESVPCEQERFALFAASQSGMCDESARIGSVLSTAHGAILPGIFLHLRQGCLRERAPTIQSYICER